MARPRYVDAALVERAREFVLQTSDAEELRAAQAVLLPAVAGTSLEQTAAVLGVSRASVARLQHRFRGLQQSELPRRRWGGRRRALLSPAAEAEFLAPWAAQAKDAGLLVLSPLRAALAQHLGRPVAASVVWRLLTRHGWRKVAPDTRNPKSDPAAQAAWKKTPGGIGAPVDADRRPGAPRSVALSGRGAVWPDGTSQAVLGTATLPSDDAQRLRAGVCVRVRSGQPAPRNTGLADLPGDEHSTHERIPPPSESGSPA